MRALRKTTTIGAVKEPTILEHRADRGFTMLELIVIVAVIAILAAAAAPLMFQEVAETRVEATRSEARALYEAMVGTPAQGTQFGFVGDIGRLPDSFQELAAPGGLPSYSTGNIRGVGMGWRGPYANIGTSPDDYLTDAFGRAYAGASSGQVRSAGVDGILNNADDIVYPPSPPLIVGDVAVTVKTMETQGGRGGGAAIVVVDPAGYRVELFYASNGSQTSVGDSDGPFTFANVPMGIHAVRVVRTQSPDAGSVVAEDTIVVRPGSTTAAELWF